MGRGIRVTIRNLGAFAAVVETIFVDQDYAAKRVGELSNYNIPKRFVFLTRYHLLNVECRGSDKALRDRRNGGTIA